MKKVESTYKKLYEMFAKKDEMLAKGHKDEILIKFFPYSRIILCGLLAGKIKDKRILDLGCNTAILSRILNGYKEYVGIEISSYLCNKIKPKKNVKIVNANVEDKSIADLGKFDIIFCLELLEHVQNPIKLFENIREMAHKDTIIIFSTPYKLNPKQQEQELNVGHLRLFDAHKFSVILNAFGLEIEKINHIGKEFSFLVIINNYLELIKDNTLMEVRYETSMIVKTRLKDV